MPSSPPQQTSFVPNTDLSDVLLVFKDFLTLEKYETCDVCRKKNQGKYHLNANYEINERKETTTIFQKCLQFPSPSFPPHNGITQNTLFEM